jgi:Ca2+-binding RTX toxin-like protein
MKAASLQHAFAGLDVGIGGTRRRRPTQGHPPAYSAALAEALEWRKLLSVSFSGGVITVTGTNLGDEIIAIQTLVEGTQTKQIRILDNGTPSSWFTLVTRIDVNGNAGDDYIEIETDNDHTHGGTMGVDANTHLTGGAGDDTIWAGDQNDTVEGGTGNDWIHGRDGSDQLKGNFNGTAAGANGNNNTDVDTIYGGLQSDTIYGQDSPDLLYGGNGDFSSDNAADVMYGDFATSMYGNLYESGDTMFGEGGNDTMSGDSGGISFSFGLANDSMDGGDGADVMYGEAAISNGYGSDTITGGTGSDTVYGGYGYDVFLMQDSPTTADVIHVGADSSFAYDSVHSEIDSGVDTILT